MGQGEHERYLVELPVRLAVDSVGTVIVYNPGAGGCKIVRVNWMSLGCSLLSGRATMARPVTIRKAVVGWSPHIEFRLVSFGMEESKWNVLAEYFADWLLLPLK